jgi:hypothetical protein
LHLGQRQPLQVFHGEFHSPAASTTTSSRFQAHPALENSGTCIVPPICETLASFPLGHFS